MSYEVEVNYYNSYNLRRLITNRDSTDSGANGKGTSFPSGAPYVRFIRTWPSVENSNYEKDGFPFWAPNPVSVPSPFTSTPVSNVAYNASQWAIGSTDPNWTIEEARIRGGFNNTSTDYGVRAYLVEENPQQNTRFNSIIYSGIYNSRTSFNETNVFSVAQDISKSLDPHYGSIQKMYAEDSNLTIFQENKVSKALIDKDAIYSAEGGGAVTSTNLVIGQVTPYSGEYGISKNPESFDFFGFRKYFTDKYRNVVCRLSRDGITEISNYGMSDFFRDELSLLNDNFVTYCVEFLDPGSLTQSPTWPYPNPLPPFATPITLTITGFSAAELGKIEPGMGLYLKKSGSLLDTQSYVVDVNTSTGVITLNQLPGQQLTVTGDPADGVAFCSFKKDKAIGTYDTYKDNYILSLVKAQTVPDVEPDYDTITYDEQSQGWVSFLSYRPEQTRSLRNNLYSTRGNSLYLHYSDLVGRNIWYGQAVVESSVTFIFNPNVSINKNFKTINYEGTNGWEVDSFVSDSEEFISGNSFDDTTKKVYSYDEGSYIENGITYRLGFDLKENKYFANLRGDSSVRPGQVIISEYGENVSGIKGYLATVKISTDSSTQPEGTKELFAVSSEYVVSSY